MGIKRKNYSWVYLTIFSFGILGVNTFISFWARYLMPVIPLFILFILYVFRKYTAIIFLLVILNLTILVPIFTTNNLSGHAGAVDRFLNTRAYREIYRSIDQETRSKYPEKIFIQTMENFYVTFGVKKIEVSVTDIVDTKDVHQGKLNTQYLTDYGNFSNTQEIKFVIEQNQWKTIWKWDYLWPGFDPDGKIEIKATSNKPLVKVRTGVYVIPRLMYDWGSYSAALSILTKMSGHEVDVKIRETIPDDFPRFVGYLDPGIDTDTLQRNTLPGIRIKNEPAVYPGSIFFVDTKGTKTTLPINKN